MMTTWRKLLADRAGDEPIVAYAPDEATFDIEFDDGFGGANGPDVLAWSTTRVFFPVVYDGAEWIESAPRNPVPAGQEHVGGH
jgi:hypothetical protein